MADSRPKLGALLLSIFKNKQSSQNMLDSPIQSTNPNSNQPPPMSQDGAVLSDPLFSQSSTRPGISSN